MDNADVKKLFTRLTNFYASFDTSEEFFQKNFKFLEALAIIKNGNIEIAKQNGLSREELLYRVIADIFDFITEENPYFAMFSNKELFGILVESFSYWIICLYVHTLKSGQERAITLPDFVYNNSISGYKDNDGMYYCPPDKHSDILFSEEQMFRQYRNRQFNERNVQFRNKQWSGMTNDSIHEWRLYYKLVYDSKNKKTLSHTFNKVRKLGRIIGKMNNYTFTIDEDEDNKILSDLQSDFNSALRKISYVNFLELYKFIINHLKSEEKYYGINMFRLEKMFNPSNIIVEVSVMQNCKNQSQVSKVLERYFHFNDISEFRLLYCFLGSIDLKDAITIKHRFLNFIHAYSQFFLIVLDDYVKNDIFGEDWEIFFLNEINNIASNYYVIDDSLFEAQSDSQKNFQDLLQSTFQKAYEQKKAICKIYHENRSFFTENSNE